MVETTTQDALEFTQSVATELKNRTGIDTQEVIGICAVALDGFDVDAGRREAALREMLSPDFTQDEVSRLVSCRSTMGEPIMVAHAILVATKRIMCKRRDRDCDDVGVARFLLRQFVTFLDPKSVREDAERRRQPAMH